VNAVLRVWVLPFFFPELFFVDVFVALMKLFLLLQFFMSLNAIQDDPNMLVFPKSREAENAHLLRSKGALIRLIRLPRRPGLHTTVSREGRTGGSLGLQ